MTPSGIEPATCRFVAYCLNHYATARPSTLYSSKEYVSVLNVITLQEFWAWVKVRDRCGFVIFFLLLKVQTQFLKTVTPTALHVCLSPTMQMERL